MDTEENEGMDCTCSDCDGRSCAYNPDVQSCEDCDDPDCTLNYDCNCGDPCTFDCNGNCSNCHDEECPASVCNIKESIAPDPYTMQVKTLADHCKIEAAHPGEWFDLSVEKDMSIKAGDYGLISLGVCISLPAACEAIMAPRSSTFKKYGLLQTNGIGVIDNAYCGDNDVWKFPYYATRDVELKAGTRIAQFRVQFTQPAIGINYVDSLNAVDRGGIGSTGD